MSVKKLHISDCHVLDRFYHNNLYFNVYVISACIACQNDSFSAICNKHNVY